MSIEIMPLDMGQLDIIADMAIENYHLERDQTTTLTNQVDVEKFCRELTELLQQGRSWMAIDEGRVAGFLAFGSVFSIGAGDVRGATCPLTGYGVRHPRRGLVMARLFQHAASVLCEEGAQSLRVHVYAHDAEVLWMYLMSGFSMELTNAVRSVQIPVEGAMDGAYLIRELDLYELNRYRLELVELYRGLINHLRVSPVFYHGRPFLPVEGCVDAFIQAGARVFAAFEGERIAGFVNAYPPESQLALCNGDARSMGDVFVLPEARGHGIGAGLLRCANSKLQEEGIARLYVTHGTINPTARGFWDKHFTNYTYTLARQIDPDMLGPIALF